MAKRNKGTKPAKQTETATTAVATIAAPTVVGADGKATPALIKEVKAGLKYRGARQAWYERLLKFEGKPAGDYLADTTANPPSMPKSGVQEKSSGWLSFFQRTGVAKVG